jgi:integrase
MSVRVVPCEKGGFEVDVRLKLPNGHRHRERKILSGVSRSSATRWGQGRERQLLLHGLPQPTKEVPTLKEFAPRFLDGHARANRQKPSGIAAKEMLLRIYILPLLGHKRLDTVVNEDVQRLKRSMQTKSPKTVNNVLSVLSVLLKKAVEWEVMDRVPCSIKLLRIPKAEAAFHDFDGFERLVEAAGQIDAEARLIVLLGGEAGLRCGEMIALERRDVDLANRRLCVQRSDWNGQVTSPKGGRLRYVPLTQRLTQALREHRHLRSPRVLCQSDGSSMTRQQIQYRVQRAARQANVAKGVHILRHTFCSHLAMRGAPAKAIQELAGHSELGTTQRYMHLSSTALESAIRLLDRPALPPLGGAGGETVGVGS